MEFKVFYSSVRIIGNFIKTFVPMKTIILLTIFVCLFSATQCYSQTITLSLKNVSLEKTFKEIRKQTGYTFVYTREQINKSNPVSINIKDALLNQALDVCFTNQPLTFIIEDQHIIVKDRPDKINSLPGNVGIDITGKVINEENEPVVGATVAVEGTGIAMATDSKGEFGFSNLKANDVLNVTNIGYQSLKISLAGRTRITIKMTRVLGQLDETVIIAYGKTTKRLNTGSVSKVSADEIESQPVSNPLSPIQGRMPGVFVSTQNGMPGGNIVVQIRGKGSINAGTDPLYIVDGVPFISEPLNFTFSTLSTGIGGSTSPLNSINPNDIESIEVLKDADATAIYGSRAANGVILITTKKGKDGKTKVDLNLNTGISRLADFPKLLNLSEYLELRREGFKNDGIIPTISNAPDLLVWDTTKSTNWPKYMLGGTSLSTSAQMSISGGNQYTNFLLSGNFRSEGTILPGSEKYQRNGMHLTLHHSSINRKFALDFSSSYTVDNNRSLSSSIFTTLTLPPNAPIYDSSGNYNWVGISTNPAAILLDKSKSATDNILGNLTLQYEILPNLRIKTNFGYTKIELDQVMTYPKISLNPNYGSSSYAYYGDNRNTTYIVEPQIEYEKKINGSDIKLLLGTSYQYSIQEGSFISGNDYSNDDLLEFAGAAGTITATNLYTEYKYASIFGRFQYNYKEKYLVNLSMRRDGSSRFGPGKQYGNFGAVGAAWIFSKESFLSKSKLLSYGKIRSSYGVTGNDLIDNYQYLSTYGITGTNYQDIVTLAPFRIANANFGWENNKKFETALEIGLLKDRILFTAAWYLNRSGNQLIDYPLPYTSGPFGNYQANLPALIENYGWEFETNVFAIRTKNVSWSISGNISLPKNKLLKYPGLAASSFANSYVIGEDINIKKALHFTGVNSQTGLPEYEDVNHDGSITTPEDYVIVGKTSPFFYGGFGSNLSYKQFEIDIFFQFSKQYVQGLATIPGLLQNNFDVALTRWQKPGDKTNISRATVNPSDEYFNLPQSDAAFYNGSYLRLKNLAVSYNLPAKLAKHLRINNCKFYAEAQNLITWRKDTNLYDPETGTLGIPPMKSIVGGIKITF